MEIGNKAGKIERMKELAELLQRASKAYYQEDREIMSNREYDELYDELVRLEEESGTVLTGSPTVTVGYEAVDELPKEAHESPMLSLDKTKEREALRSFIGETEKRCFPGKWMVLRLFLLIGRGNFTRRLPGETA